MPLNKTIRRELEVAFSKRSQSHGVRAIKYILLAVLVFFFYRSRLFWIILGSAFILAIAVHLFYRYKTKAWTRSYGGWKYDKDDPAGDSVH